MIARKSKEQRRAEDKHNKELKRKRDQKQKRIAQSISRKKRNYVRRKISPYFDAFKKYKNKHLLIVLKDTENMEKILFQAHSMGRGMTLISLPVINEEMIKKYLEEVPNVKSQETGISADDKDAINGFASHFYGIRAKDVIDVPKSNMLVMRDCQITNLKDGLVALNVRPYNVHTWFTNEVTSLSGFRVYSGKQLKSFFNIDDHDTSKTYVFQDTLSEILMYRAMRGKVKMRDVVIDHELYGKRGIATTGPHDLMYLSRNERSELYNRFKNEKREKRSLDGEDGREDL